MKTYAIVLIVLGSVAAGILTLCCLCSIGRKKKQLPATSQARPSAPRPPSDYDVEKGQTAKTGAMRDGGMAILGATAAVAAATMAAEAVFGGGGGGCDDSGTGGGHGSGGGCGGGGVCHVKVKGGKREW